MSVFPPAITHRRTFIIVRDDCEAKFELIPSVAETENWGFPNHELTDIRDFLRKHRTFLLKKWREING